MVIQTRSYLPIRLHVVHKTIYYVAWSILLLEVAIRVYSIDSCYKLDCYGQLALIVSIVSRLSLRIARRGFIMNHRWTVHWITQYSICIVRVGVVSYESVGSLVCTGQLVLLADYCTYLESVLFFLKRWVASIHVHLGRVCGHLTYLIMFLLNAFQ